MGDLRLPPAPPLGEHAWHLYVVRTVEPDALASFLASQGIATGRHYPVPLHLAPAFRELGYRRGEFPNAEKIAAECLSLPLWSGRAAMLQILHEPGGPLNKGGA